MTVQELIDQLSQFDKNKEVNFVAYIESGRSVSITEGPDILADISEDPMYVELALSGEETDYQ